MGEVGLLSFGPAPGSALRHFEEVGEVKFLSDYVVPAFDLREAERLGWVYGYGDHWQLTEAGARARGDHEGTRC